MPKKGDLLDAVLTDNSSDAMSITCAYLHDGMIAALEDEWIAISAYIGKTFGLAFGGLWTIVNKYIIQLLVADELDVTSVFLCTTKLLLLYKRCKQHMCSSLQLNVATLRSKVIKFFPEDAGLSSAGIKRYIRILPYHEASLNMKTNKDKLEYGNNTQRNEDDESRSTLHLDMYCKRILAGLSKLMIEKKYDDIRNSIEYISKKKVRVPLLDKWPAPTIDDAEKGDMCWFLWGALSCFYGEDLVATNYKLFTWNWRKSSRNERLGLLLGLPYIIDTNVSAEWTYNEISIMERVESSATELWAEYRESHSQYDSDDNVSASSQSLSQLDNLLNTYIPRTDTSTSTSTSTFKTTSYTQQSPRMSTINNTHDYDESLSSSRSRTISLVKHKKYPK
jgi:hypothetical protein